MPTYQAPGVYVEEVSFRANTIGGVSTSIAAFIGPTLFGPPFGVPELLTSLSDFERIYGGLDPLQFEDAGESINYMAQGVRAFFENGGQQLYVSRVLSSVARGTEEDDPTAVYVPYGTQCCATATIDDSQSPPDLIDLLARWPGAGGTVELTFTVHVSQNVLAGTPHNPLNPSGPKDPVLRGVRDYDTLWIKQASSSPNPGELYWADNFLDPVTKQWNWRFHSEAGTLDLATLVPGTGGDDVRIITVSADITYPGAFPRTDTFDGLTFHPDHPMSLSQFFGTKLASRSRELTVPLIFDPTSQFNNGPQIARIMMTQSRTAVERGRLLRLLSLNASDTTTDLSILATLGYAQLADTDRQIQVVLSGGLDGFKPPSGYYEGTDIDPKAKTGLTSLEDLTDVSIVAAPGHSAGGNETTQAMDDMLTVDNLMIAHCEKMRYRIAVFDSADGQDLTDVSLYRAQLDSSYAAIYYPWIRIVDPVTENEIDLPPSGFVAGLYAENDIVTGVHKAPANMVVNLAIGFELMLNKAQQDVLNPVGINCFRYFENRGYRLWGARTISSDPQWKYVNLRRYFAYLEHSIDLGTQWVVFENNNEQLWSNVVRTVSDFLYDEWKSGHLIGDKPEQAIFRSLRPVDHDAKRSRQWQADLPDWRVTGRARRVCDLPYRPMGRNESELNRIRGTYGNTKRSPI